MTLKVDPLTPSFGNADLTNCDREPIHIPGSIQPHGVLLVLQEPDLTIVQASDNTEQLLEVPVQELLLSPLSTFLTDDCLHFFSKNNLKVEELAVQNPLSITTQAKNEKQSWDGILHRSQGLLLLELEKAPKRDPTSISAFSRQAKQSLYNLQSSGKLSELFEIAAVEVKRLTGFDRVMIYRFNEGGEGEVIAEVKEESLEPFFGLRYPASDIPKQARTLYEKNWLRLIPNASYKATPILPAENPLLDTPLDLSFSGLRSVSPIHYQYLRNMGVNASMSISLLRDGKLWGLIACHHYVSEKFVPFEVRTVCEFLGQMISWQLSSKIENDNNEHRVMIKRFEAELIQAMSSESNFTHGLAKNERSLLGLVEASGAAIYYEGEIYLLGQTPSLDQIKSLMTWLQEHQDGAPVFETNSLIKHYPAAESFKDTASGILSISIAKTNQEFLTWFKPEVMQVVNWAGDPKKSVEVSESGQHLSPRTSFALWKEEVKFQSLPWTSWQIDGAKDLRASILGIIVRKASQIKRLNSELSKAVQSRDDFMSVASHELKTPLTTLLLQVQLMLKSAKQTKGDLPREIIIPKLEIAGDQVLRLDKLVENLMDVSRITSGKLKLDLEDGVNLSEVVKHSISILEPEFRRVGRELRIKSQPNVTGHWDIMRLTQVVTNLISNALKYGGAKPVEVTLSANEDNAILSVKDHGIGIAEEKLGRIFDRFERAVSEHSYKGLGLGLWITRQIVEGKGGKITVRSELGKGSEFIVEIPRKPKYSETIAD